MVPWALALVAALVAVAVAAFRISPWPGALLIRRAFDEEAARVSAALARHVPEGVAERLDQHYDPADRHAYLDLYHPARIPGDGRLPTVVWVHGGAWVSGDKRHVANYARILAREGYTVVAVGYSIAPGARYPTPLRQLASALAYLQREAARLHVDPGRIFLAGDSAGAQIAAQMATIITVPSYAAAVGVAPPLARSQLAGILLHCGAYDVGQVDLEGPFGGFLRTVLWAYSGTKAFREDPAVATISVIHYITADFPPLFISSGDADPLTPQSRAFAAAAAGMGIPVDSLFFAPGHDPPLPHEYQFDLDTEAGRLSLERSVRFLAAMSQ